MTDRESIIKMLDDHDPEGGTNPEDRETFWGAQADALLEWLAEHDRQTGEKAWYEGMEAGQKAIVTRAFTPNNPYEKDTTA